MFGGTNYLLYLCINKQQINHIMETSMEYPTKELRIQKSINEHPLSFNEWCEKYGVSSRYVEPTKLFQGNPSSGFQEVQIESPIEKFFKNFAKIF